MINTQTIEKFEIIDNYVHIKIDNFCKIKKIRNSQLIEIKY